jgi:anthranilate phosphoribosyltransferase
LTGPIRGRQKTHLLSGYVHNEYPPIYTMLARHSGFSSTLLSRGTEGAVTPSLRKRGVFVRYWEDSKDMNVEADPAGIGIQSVNRLVPIPPALLTDKDRDFGPDENNTEIAKLSAQEGLAALQRLKSPTSDDLIFSASLTLWHLERFSSINEASVAVRKILFSGKAAQRFNRAA